MAAAGFGAYADLDVERAERHLAADAGMPRTALMVTAGATEALRLATQVLLHEGDRAVVLGPTYGEYGRVAALRGARVEEVRAALPALRPPLGELFERLDGASAVFVCDPNNPTGAALGAERLRALVHAARERGCALVLDQSFAPFSGSFGAPPLDGEVVVVRSLTKVLAAPGLRLGYVLACPAMIARLRALRDPWSVSAHALRAAEVASWSLPPATVRLVRAWRARLACGLAARGLAPLPSPANFVLAHAGRGAEAIVRGLARRRIAVRRCASFGLPEHVRVAVRPPEEQDALFAALDALSREVSP